MNTAFYIAIWTWIVLVAVVLLLAIYRLLISRGEYTLLHVRRSELSLLPEQIMRDHRISRIDLWGQVLTAVSLIFGLMLAAVYLYVAVGRTTGQG